MNHWEAVIGLEIHVELLTRSKLFCGCATTFGSPPNTQVCPVCLGLPGTLPVLNKRAVELLLRTALALDCTVPPRSKFDRKNYFYPDMPKNYQISQYDLPLSQHGKLAIGEGRVIGIRRIHLEEDTGKSLHVAEANGGPMVGGRIGEGSHTYLDYNRAGVPLMEIVTEPDLRSPEEAREFLERLKLTLEYLEVSNCKMEEGSLRCDANVSLRQGGANELGVKTEIKNMNSFRSVERALAYEIERQATLLIKGERIVQETRAWDEKREVTFSMRSKEEAHDYRYFPDPDLLPLEIPVEWLDRIREELPELPRTRQARFEREHGLSRADSQVLCATRDMADFFEGITRLYPNARAAANWLRGDVAKYLNETKRTLGEVPLTPEGLAELLLLIDKGTINGKIAKEVLAEMLVSGKSAATIVKERGLEQIADEGALRGIVEAVLADPASIKSMEEYRGGKDKALAFLVGQVMKRSEGKANPALVNQLLKEMLGSPSR